MLKIFVCLIFLFALNYLIEINAAKPCDLQLVNGNLVCVCNATYCDEMDNIDLEHPNELAIVTTSKNGLRFAETKSQFHITANGLKETPKIIINDPAGTKIDKKHSITANVNVKRDKKYQKMVGFGTSFTGLTSDILNELPIALQESVYKSCYSPDKGIGLNIMRIPIGGTSFNKNPWAYAEYPPGDRSLSGFTQLNELDTRAISQIKKLENVANNYNIRYFGGAWTPPRWMKSNFEWSGKSKLPKEYYQTWAKYHLRWLELMNENNMTFWAITTGNEPTDATIAWKLTNNPDLGWTAWNQGVWLNDNLGPTLKNSAFKHVKILGVDGQSMSIPWWLDRMKESRTNSLDYIDGITVHWFIRSIVPATYIYNTFEKYPDKFILNSESSLNQLNLTGSWTAAERYLIEYHKDFTHASHGWVHWNMLTDDIPGLRYQIADALITTNNNKDKIYKQPMLYAVGQYSKFVQPGSQRINVHSSHYEVLPISFERPDGKTILILFNVAQVKAAITVQDQQRKITMEVPPNSVQTIIYT